MLEQRLPELIDFVESKDLVYLDTCFLYGGPGNFPNGTYALKRPAEEAEEMKEVNRDLDHTLALLNRENCFVTCKVLWELNHHTYNMDKKYSAAARHFSPFQDFLDRMNGLCDLAYTKTRMPRDGKHYGMIMKKILEISEKIKGPLETRGNDSLADEEIVTAGLCVALSEDLNVGIGSSDAHVSRILTKGKQELMKHTEGNCDLYLLL